MFVEQFTTRGEVGRTYSFNGHLSYWLPKRPASSGFKFDNIRSSDKKINTGKLTESYIKQFSVWFMLGSENLKGQADMTLRHASSCFGQKIVTKIKRLVTNKNMI